MKEYYNILELTEDEAKLTGSAFQDVCKKNYRRLSKEWHPDRHVNDSKEKQKEAEEKFKKISEAYSVLSDDQKRARYDNEDNFSFDGSGFDPFEAFRNHFGGHGFNFGGFNFGGFGQPQQRQNVGTNVEVVVNLTLKEAYSGGKKEITYEKEVPCDACNGTGAEDGKTTKCPHCNGTGMITQTKMQGNMYMQQMSPCPYCHGSGTINEHPCKKCNGRGTEKKKVTAIIDFPAGVDTDMAMEIRGGGNAAQGGGIDGNLIVVFKVSGDNYFVRENLNVVHDDYVPFNEALLGFEKEYNTLNGNKIKMTIPPCTHDNAEFVKRGMGMRHVNNPSVSGDYIIRIRYIYPHKLTDNQKKLLEEFGK